MEQFDQSREPPGIRGVPLLPDEKVVSLFSRDDGTVWEVPREGPLLALTTKRVLSFSEDGDRKETTATVLSSIHAATTTVSRRNTRVLMQGLLLILLGVIAYLLTGLFIVRDGVLIPAVVGTVIGLFGAYQVLRYLFWEEEGAITFQAWGNEQSAGSWKLAFQCQGASAKEVQQFVNAFFKLKLQEKPDERAPEGRAPEGVGSPLAERDPHSPSTALATEKPYSPIFAPGQPNAPWEESESPSPSTDEGETRGKLPDTGIGDDVQG
jgi:hypothetical protein